MQYKDSNCWKAKEFSKSAAAPYKEETKAYINMQKNTVKNLNKLAKNLETLDLKSATEDAPLVSWGSWMIPLSNYSIHETIFK